MASVMFFAGVGTKLKGKTTRLTMLIVAGILCAGAIAAMLSLRNDPWISDPPVLTAIQKRRQDFRISLYKRPWQGSNLRHTV